MMKKKAFIFDFDGTLAETFPLIFKAMLLAYESLGLEAPSVETICANFGPHELGVLKRLNPDRAEEIFSAYIRATNDMVANEGLSAFDGIEDILEYLKSRGMKIALITGKSKQSLEITLKAIGLDNYFDVLKWGGSQGSIKPQRLREVFSELGISPEQAYYVGDSVQDILDCREVGVDILSAAWADCANVQELERHAPFAIVDTVMQLRDYC